MNPRDTQPPAHPFPNDIRAIEHGPRRGESIVFIHGGNSAGWTWLGLVEAMPTRHILTPDVLGYASRSDETWPGAAGAADDIARLIQQRAIDGRAHVVGLSLGGFVATHLVQRHPDIIRSCVMSGSALSGYGPLERRLVTAQIPLWRMRWYWAAQARLFRIPQDSRQLYIDDASAPTKRTNRLMARQILHHRLPDDRFDYRGPVLAIAAEHDSASVRKAFPDLIAALPQTQTWTAPHVHHAWYAEAPELFKDMVLQYADTGVWP